MRRDRGRPRGGWRRLWHPESGATVPSMARRGRWVALVVSAWLVACGGAGSPATEPASESRGRPVTLEVALEDGATYEGQLSMVHAAATGQRVKTVLSIRTRVLGVEGDVFRLEDSFGDLQLHMNDEEFEPAPEMEGIDQVRIRYTMDRRGRSVGDVEAVGVTEENAAFAEQLVATATSDTVPFPADPIRAGQSWSASRDVEMETAAGVLEGRIHERHELARVEQEKGEDWAVVLISGSIRIDPLEEEEIRIRGEGDVSGERRVLLRDGFTTRAHTELTVTFRGKGGSPPQSFRMQERTSTRLRVARTPDARDAPDTEPSPAEEAPPRDPPADPAAPKGAP